MLYSSLERITNAILAPIRVLKDKTADKITDVLNLLEPDENPNINPELENVNTEEIKITRMYPKNVICEYVTFFSDPTLVHDNLYLGSAYNAASYQTLMKYNIRYIINVTNEITNYYPDDFTYYRIPIRDNNIDSMQEHFSTSYEKINEYMNNKNGNILVHCYMGASRSFTVTAHYIAKTTGNNISEVTLRLKELRPNVNPTQRFLTDLIEEINK